MCSQRDYKGTEERRGKQAFELSLPVAETLAVLEVLPCLGLQLLKSLTSPAENQQIWVSHRRHLTAL